MIQKNIIWKGIDAASLENSIITITKSGNTVHATVVGVSGEIPFKIDYLIRTDEHWRTNYLELHTQLLNKTSIDTYRSDAQGNWHKEEKLLIAFEGCIEIDISVTPFTNSLAVNR